MNQRLFELTIQVTDHDLREVHPVLSATFDAERRIVLKAAVETAANGDLTHDGAQAFRCMALSDAAMRVALGLPAEMEELHALRARVAELEAQLKLSAEVLA